MRCLFAWLIVALASHSHLTLGDDADQQQHAGQIQDIRCDEAFLASARPWVVSKANAQSYIVCVSTGWGILKSCENASRFDATAQACVAESIGDVQSAVANVTVSTTSTSTVGNSMSSAGDSTTIEPASESSTSSSTTIAASTEASNSTDEAVSRYVRFVQFFRAVGAINNRVLAVQAKKINVERVKIGCNGTDPCINGVCNEWSNGTKCICLVDFEGEFCENNKVRNASSSLQDQIQKGQFDIDEFVRRIAAQIGDKSGAADIAGAKSNVLNVASANVTYGEFVSRMVGQLWAEINQEGEFLKAIDFAQILNESVVENVPVMLQRVRFYARYALLNVDTELKQLEASLDLIGKRYGNSSIRLNAIQELERSVHKAIDVKVGDAIEVHEHALNKSELVPVIRSALNRTVCQTKQLYNAYVAQRSDNKTAVVYTPEQVQVFLAKIQNSTVVSWNAAVQYGAKYLTHKLSGNNVIVSVGQAKSVTRRRSSRGVFQARM